MTQNYLIKRLNCYLKISPVHFRRIFCGKEIDRGKYRKVYEFRLAPKRYVVKIQNKPAFENQMEWHLYQEIRLSKQYRTYFAKPLWMNKVGTILIMQQARVRTRKKLPNKIPFFMSDVHKGNYGWIGKRFVCIDYGNTVITKFWTLRTKNIKWKY